MRDYDVTMLTAAELDRARRELAASLALARLGSPVRAPILAASAPSTPNWPGAAARRLPAGRQA